MSDAMFKPGYEGVRPSTQLTGPEKQKYRLGKGALVARLHRAMLTLAAMDSLADLGIRNGGTPDHIVEFFDRIGQEEEPARPARFQPTGADVDAVDATLALLEGLRPAFFKVVLFRALHDFARENAEQGEWTFEKIGAYFGLSERWAIGAYDAAIIQAARRSGLIPMVATDYAVVIIAVRHERRWLTNISLAADPRQAVANFKTKSPLRPDQAYCMWTAGQPAAKRVVEQIKPTIRNLLSHGSWYRSNPDVLAEQLTEAAREAKVEWMLEDFIVPQLAAA